MQARLSYLRSLDKVLRQHPRQYSRRGKWFLKTGINCLLKATDPSNTLTALKNNLQPYIMKGWNAAYGFDYGDFPPDMLRKSKPASIELLNEWDHIPTEEDIVT